VVNQATIAIGTHVRLRDHPVGVRLRSFGGMIARLDEPDGYLVVRLDEPAIYFHAEGTTENLAEIVEARDNLIIEPVNDPLGSTGPAQEATS
jgi:hypothetical protein